MSEPEITCDTRGAAGFATLNRPKALNALTHGMVRDLSRALDAWKADPAIRSVVVAGAGGRAFSAGGDIVAVYHGGRDGRLDDVLPFFRDEYLLNTRIKRYPKPYVSLIDGIVMGGGVGLSLHGSHRIAGDGYRFAMPEVGIGFFPDVGGTYALPRLAGFVGHYLALTGARIGPDDACRCGLATHRVDSGSLAAVADALASGSAVDEVLAGIAKPPSEGALAAHLPLIAACFSAPGVDEILRRLDLEAAGGSDFARDTAAGMRAKSPASVAIAFEQMRRGPDLTFEAAMATEMRVVTRILAGHDFYEGVRTTLIDRGAAPSWSPATFGEIEPGFVDRHFAPLGSAEIGAVELGA